MNAKEFWEKVHSGEVKVGDTIHIVHVSGFVDVIVVKNIEREKDVSPNDPDVKESDLCVEGFSKTIWQSAERDFGQTYLLTSCS